MTPGVAPHPVLGKLRATGRGADGRRGGTGVGAAAAELTEQVKANLNALSFSDKYG